MTASDSGDAPGYDDDNAVGPDDHAVGPDCRDIFQADDAVGPDDRDIEPSPRPATMALAGLSAGFGLIGVSIGFATVLGLTATASAGSDTTGFGPLVASGVASLFLGALLLVGAVLLWLAKRSSLVVISAGVTLLALSSLGRMLVDATTFLSVVGSVFSLLALVVMGYLITNDEVREHVREGEPIRLR